MMVLDECLAYPASHEAARVSTERTLRWARAGYDHYQTPADGEHACFPIVQGSMYADLRRHCAQELLELDAEGTRSADYRRRARALSLEMTEVTTPLLPQDRPRYVMGVGMPEELPEYVARGVDMMDCVLPSRNARNGYLFTSRARGHQASPVQGRSAPGGRDMRLLRLPQLFAGLSSPSVLGRRDDVFDSRNAA
jgi:queuine tRNA-ribosyltransferase